VAHSIANYRLVQLNKGRQGKIAILRVLGPFKTTIILSAAVQEGFLRWGNGFNRGFRVATGKTVVFGVLDFNDVRPDVPIEFFLFFTTLSLSTLGCGLGLLEVTRITSLDAHCLIQAMRYAA
jgi:hypothetical protein